MKFQRFVRSCDGSKILQVASKNRVSGVGGFRIDLDRSCQVRQGFLTTADVAEIQAQVAGASSHASVVGAELLFLLNQSLTIQRNQRAGIELRDESNADDAVKDHR